MIAGKVHRSSPVDHGLVGAGAALLAAFAGLALVGFLVSSALIGEIAYVPLLGSALLVLLANVREARTTPT